MQLDEKREYMIECIENAMKEYFHLDAEEVEIIKDFKMMGYFSIKYHHGPTGYILNFENYQASFNIFIIGKDGAMTSLYDIEKYNSSLNEENINKAILLLKKVLNENNFDFVIEIDGKTYIKNKNGLTRVD